MPLNDSSSDAGIEVASLQNVCWLEVLGKLDASYLSPGVTYEVAFLVMMKDPSYGWHVSVNLRLVCPGGVSQDHKVSLNDSNLRNRWVELPVGTFSTGEGLKGEIEFSMFEYGGGIWKRGLVIRGAVIRPVRLVCG
ncbi:Protein PHLOEM PROTEIN 2-LIKE A2 [Acorus gramineus]|uniref:Protein PHLOEM PROTEIN 2-LIKE A2 n=1 Tax=Acorus gramineus TaxID=55184 RepID=A0AAV9BS65_ACOGR|nr:Protein PHLOEM PROTEIN 2-LIKE A2 [Acorus gramineus]